MTPALLYTFIILHIITAAAWFGAGLRLAGRARRVAQEKTPQAAQALFEDGKGNVRLMSIMIVLTIIFAYAAFFIGGGFAAYTPPYHISLTLILILAAVHFLAIRSGWLGLKDGLDRDDAELLDSNRKKVAIGTGVGHLLWLIILILMFWPRISGLF